jgi:hypothetical protein
MANNIATSLRLTADVPQLISAWHRGRRMAIDAGHARSGSKDWFVLEGVGGGLLPAGIAAAERALESADAHPAVEVAAAVQLFYDVLKDLEPVRRRIAIDDRIIDKDLLMFEVLNIRSVGPNLVLGPDANQPTGYSTSSRSQHIGASSSRISNRAWRSARVWPPCVRRHARTSNRAKSSTSTTSAWRCADPADWISVTAGAVTLLI